jgi:hypothetical protein
MGKYAEGRVEIFFEVALLYVHMLWKKKRQSV